MRTPRPPSNSNRTRDLALPFTLSVIAGCTDVTGFLGLDGLFTNHITGNLVLISAHLVEGREVSTAKVLALPVYFVAASLATAFARRLESSGIASLRPLLVLQLVLLAALLSFCIVADAGATRVLAAGMIGVAAMAVQNALVQISLPGMPATAMMTSNVTRLAIDVADVLRGGDATRVAEARRRATRTLPVIVGFALGCALGAACEAAIGLRAFIVPAGLAALALSRVPMRCN